VKELEDFFVNYHELSGKQYRILDVRGPGEAVGVLKTACARRKNNKDFKD
jgi:hypothetical protein